MDISGTAINTMASPIDPVNVIPSLPYEPPQRNPANKIVSDKRQPRPLFTPGKHHVKISPFEYALTPSYLAQ